MFLQFAGVLSLSQRSFCSTPSEEDKVAVYSEEKESIRGIAIIVPAIFIRKEG